MKKSGFTLVEIVVVTMAVGLILTAMIGIVLSTFKSQNRTKSSTNVSQNGAWILNELRRDILGSDSWKIFCNPSGLSVGFTNINDGEWTVLKCENNRIASDSARNPAILSGSEVVVTSCANFVNCSTLPSSEVSAVNFNFNLSSDVAGIGSSQDFNLKVTIRN